MSRLTVSPSPHIFAHNSTQSIMLDVILALLPAAVASVIFFGAASIAVIAVCVISSFAAEFIFNLIVKKAL